MKVDACDETLHCGSAIVDRNSSACFVRRVSDWNQQDDGLTVCRDSSGDTGLSRYKVKPEAGSQEGTKEAFTGRRNAPSDGRQEMEGLAKIIVGYALTSKKTKSFLKPKLEVIARDKGIVFVAIDRSRPLKEQGPFDVVLHKITGREWWSQLEDFKQRHPDVVVLDPPDAIQHLRNRQSMLQEVAKLKLGNCGGQVDIPRQLVVTGDPATIPDVVAKAGLKLPLVAKPLVVDGSAQSHALSLAYDEVCLSELNPPLVLQEFVNHGGVLFKVYIVGDSIRVVRRFSLPDVHEQEAGNGVMPFPRVSSAAASADDADLDPQVAALPPCELLDSLSKELRHRLGLRLFNLDIIREGGAGNHYYVIDINYFPGFGKMPDYEHVFTDFLLNLARKSKKEVVQGGCKPVYGLHSEPCLK